MLALWSDVRRRIYWPLQVKLPAVSEDWVKRPAYIQNNDAGVPICDNRYGDGQYAIHPHVSVMGRLQYLVHKGAIVRKG
jgi:hypothetical protein